MGGGEVHERSKRDKTSRVTPLDESLEGPRIKKSRGGKKRGPKELAYPWKPHTVLIL